MIYSSLEFLIAFPAFCVTYWAIPRQRARLILLLVGSLAFYAYGELAGLPLLIGVVALSYVSGRAIARWREATGVIVAVGIAALLLDLAYFKYAAFLGGLIPGLGPIHVAFLPLGLSFFTFEAIAYLVDLRRRVTHVERSPVQLGLFIAVFPHLISGPIMRPNDLLPQLKRRISWYLPTFVNGVELFIEGLAKKRLIADPSGVVADRVFADPVSASTIAAWIGALAYSVQIYGDFAGYTDMGRGIARMLGFELPLNFSAPYAAHSISDFWRRWHISLSRWLRDYLYIPLGGSRRGEGRTHMNLLVTMLLGGLWHGAGWTFLAWGGLHGVLLAIERVTRWPDRVPRVLGGVITLFLVVNAWVLFRARDFVSAAEMLRAMYVPRTGAIPPSRGAVIAVVLFVLIVGAMVIVRRYPRVVDWIRTPRMATGAVYGVAAGIALTMVLLNTAPAPFIYFRF